MKRSIHDMRRILSLLCLCHTFLTNAQPGTIDHSFNPTDVGFGYGDGASYTVWATTIQPDGKILVGGEFIHFNSLVHNSITRLGPDGVSDPGFDPGTGADDPIHTIVVQPDGRILIGGEFDMYNSTIRNRIARLTPDGGLDGSFDPGSGATNNIECILLQPDGKILIAGEFTSYNGTLRKRIARLEPDGGIDLSFNPGSGASSTIQTAALQPDGKVVIGGGFTTFNGASVNRITRLLADGSLDTTFVTGLGANDQVFAEAVQSDGRIIVAGAFTTWNGSPRQRIVRLEADGSLDTSFDPGLGANDTIRSVILQPDGKIIISGDFTSVDGSARSRAARLNVDGSLDPTFDPGSGADGWVHTAALQPDGKCVIGGEFMLFDGSARTRLARLNIDGTLDDLFNTGTGANDVVWCTALQSDDKLILGGWFTRFNGRDHNHITRLNADGDPDSTFNTGVGADGYVLCTKLQPDGRILVGGSFHSIDGVPRSKIARLLSSGAIDPTFNPGSGFAGVVHSLCIQPDGRIVAGGSFNSYNGTFQMGIARLSPDGSLDLSFNPGNGANGIVVTCILQPDGKVILTGDFTTVYGIPRNRVARINVDGSLDTSFAIGTGANDYVYTAALQPDGKILLGGLFTEFNDLPFNGILRLQSDGSIDTSFNIGTGVDERINTIALQDDGKIILGGWFTNYNGITRGRIARLNTDGTLDTSFDPGSGMDRGLQIASVLQNGQILIGGGMTNYDGIGRNRIARIHGDPSSNLAEVTGPEILGLWPNPVDQIVHVAFSNVEKGSLRVVDMHGASVLVSPMCSSLPLVGLASGVYVVQALDAGDRVVASARLVKD